MQALWRALIAMLALVWPGPIRLGAHGARLNFPVGWSSAHFGRRLDLRGYALAFGDDFDRLRLTRDGGPGPWFAPIHTPLGVGALALPGEPAFVVSGGVLTLSTRRVEGLWREANMQTADSRGRGFAFQNGYVEMRAAPAAALGAHDGLWLLSMNRGRGHVEVDVLESYGLGSPYLHAASHVWPANGAAGAASQVTLFPRLYDGYHRFGLLATDDLLISYLDGREIARIPRLSVQRAPMYVLLSVFENRAAPRREPAALKVDYVRVYQRLGPRPAPPGP